MRDDRISSIETELAKLRAEVADVRQALKIESTSSLDDSKKLWQWITRLAYKVLPEYAAARAQIEDILGPTDRPS